MTAESRMREALEPFAAVAKEIGTRGKDTECWCGQNGAVIRYGDLRRAESVLAAQAESAPFTREWLIDVIKQHTFSADAADMILDLLGVTND